MNEQIWKEIGVGFFETIYASVVATLLSLLFGVAIGVILALTDKQGLKPNIVINKILGVLVNVLRSVPFLILFVAVMPFTRVLVGTTIGATATIVPLTLAATPFVARLTDSTVKELDGGVLEAAIVCGTPVRTIVWKVILPESLPSLLSNAVITFVTVIGYSAMSGFCGGGGLGGIAINYGYYRGNETVMAVTVLVIIVIVQVFQEVGLLLARRRDKRRKAQV